MFVGRRQELEALEQAFAQERSALVPVYGRRRVGKSELILKFLKGKRNRSANGVVDGRFDR